MTTTYSEAEIRSMVSQILGGLGSEPAGRPLPPSDIESTSPEAVFAVPAPANKTAYMQMMQLTSARIGVWRAGPRPTVKSLLRFRADHAGAMDAVFSDVDQALLERLGLFCVQSAAPDKAAYLMDPNLGATFTPEVARQIKDHCTAGAQVQIIVADGLSSAAVADNLPDILPALEQGLKRQGLSTGTNLFVKLGRVRIMDEVTALLGCSVTALLVGERPGLVTNESLSCYMTYQGRPGMSESSRTVISNIYRDGTAPVEAGAYIADIARKMIETKASGMDLKL